MMVDLPQSSSHSPAQPGPGFARMTPTNIEAQRLFSMLAEASLSDPTKPIHEHCAQFLHIEPYSCIAPDRLTREESQESHTTTETDEEGSYNTAPKYQGYYILSFEVRPLYPSMGWTIGFGRSTGGASHSQVDLLLAPPGTSYSKYGVAGKHARLFFDDDAVLTLKTFSHRRSMTALGNEEFNDGQRSIIAHKSRVSFGSLCYSLEYSEMGQEEYNRAIIDYAINHLHREAPIPDFSATPSPMDTLIKDWNVRATLGAGTFGVVSAAKHVKTGKAAAAKCLVRKSPTSNKKILEEIVILKSLPSNPRLLYYINEYYERSSKWHVGISDESDERASLRTRPEKVVIIYGPYVRFSLSEPETLKQPLTVRIAAIYQVLQGLACLHGEGFIHRDIKPANIGVVQNMHEKIKIVILDYGETVRARSCEPRPGAVGTIPYLAPEMERSQYSKEVDLWAVGIVGITLFVTSGDVPWRRKVTREVPAWEEQVKQLQSAPHNSIENLLALLIAWDPAERPQAEVALRHPCFDEVRSECDIEDREEPMSGSKRKHT